MIYSIGLRIAYAYASPAIAGRQVLRMMPADLPGEQRLIAGSLNINPHPDEQSNWVDFFGNRTAECTYRAPHSEIRFEVQAQVNRSATVIAPDLASPEIPTLAKEIAEGRSLSPTAPVHFLAPSPRVLPDKAIALYARERVTPATPVVAAVHAIGTALHHDMEFDPAATTVDTPAAEAFAERHGVCQDFSHVMIAALRAVGIPAGYVSGFLRTESPKGRPRLEGADAMHAWVRAWCGAKAGWVEFDPTNDVFVGNDHIVIARGRDYSDVAPVKGVLRSAGAQASSQAVDVVPR